MASLYKTYLQCEEFIYKKPRFQGFYKSILYLSPEVNLTDPDPLSCPLPSLMVQSLLSSVQFSRSVVSDSMRPHEPQHARPPCPSPTPGVHPKPCPLNWRCHPNISFSVALFSFCLESFPASGSFPMSQLFASGGQSIGASASASVLSSEYSELISFRIDWFDLLTVQGTLKSLL